MTFATASTTHRPDSARVATVTQHAAAKPCTRLVINGGQMMFLDCPAYLDQDGAARCGLPAEVRRRFTVRSTGGPLESAMIRCPAGHWFNGPIEFLTWERTDSNDPGTAPAGAPSARHGSPRFDTVR